MKKQIVYSVLLLALFGLATLTACNSDEIATESSLEIITLETENAYKGDFLEMPVVIKVNSTIPYQELRVQANQVDGAGYSIGFTPPQSGFFGIHVDENYEARMLLSLGCDESQTFEFALKRISQNVNEENGLASLETTISASDHPSGWRKICDSPPLEKLTSTNGIIYLVENASFGFNTTSSSKILISSDYLSWSEFGILDSYIYDIEVTKNNLIHTLTLSGIQTSLDGNNWDQWPSEGLPLDDEFISPIGLLAEDSVVFVTFESPGAIHQTYRSRDKGVNWELIQSEGGVFRRLANGNLISLDEQNGLFSSQDSGNTWKSIAAQSPGGFIRSFEILSDHELVVVESEEFGSSSSVYRFDLTSLQFSEVLGGEESISDVQVVDNTIYILGGTNIFIINSGIQTIERPDFIPPITVFTPFPRGFNKIIVTGSNEFIVAEGVFSYANF